MDQKIRELDRKADLGDKEAHKELLSVLRRTDTLAWRKEWNRCPNLNCRSHNTSVHNYDPMWGDGDVMCDDCGTRVRLWDSG